MQFDPGDVIEFNSDPEDTDDVKSHIHCGVVVSQKLKKQEISVEINSQIFTYFTDEIYINHLRNNVSVYISSGLVHIGISSPFKVIDNALGQYYLDCGRTDYYDENGVGKFLKFVNENKYNENEIDLELGHNIVAEDCVFVDIDEQFPFVDEEKRNEQYSRT
eukprot:16578_1